MKTNLKQKFTTIAGLIVVLAAVASVFTGHASWQGAAVAISAALTLIFASRDGIKKQTKR